MNAQTPSVALPVVLVTLGTGWLLSALDVAPEINWVWTIALAAVGIAVVASTGVDKFSVVVTPWFLAAATLSIFRQAGYLSLNVEIPVLVILSGVLLFVARLPAVPSPRWMKLESQQ